jgi:hypothetical protein
VGGRVEEGEGEHTQFVVEDSFAWAMTSVSSFKMISLSSIVCAKNMIVFEGVCISNAFVIWCPKKSAGEQEKEKEEKIE